MIGDAKLGYAGGIVCEPWRIDRTIRLNEKSCAQILPRCIAAAHENLADLIKILRWNVRHGIRFFRISSEMFPHITNPQCCRVNQRFHKLDLFYDLEQFRHMIEQVGEFEHRLTFHPLPYTILNTQSPKHLISVIRDLQWHAEFMDMAKLDSLCTVTLHIGGIFGDKFTSAATFIRNFNALPPYIKKRIIIENDESRYNINDVIAISGQIAPYDCEYYDRESGRNIVHHVTHIPVCFDYFHYTVYNIYWQRDREKYDRQMPLKKIYPHLWTSWRTSRGARRPKVHLSEQAIDNRLGTHDADIKKIPKDLLQFDVMLESKNKEQTLLKFVK